MPYRATHSLKAVATAKRVAAQPAEKKKPPVDSGRFSTSTMKKLGVGAVLAVGVLLAEDRLDAQLIDRSPAPEAPHIVTPAQHRAEIAKSIVLPFDQCLITGVTDEHHKPPKGKGNGTTLTIRVAAPFSSAGEQAVSKYKDDKSITSTPPVGIGVILDSRKPYETTPLSLVADDNKKGSHDINNGTGEFKLYPATNVPVGTKIGVYVLSTVQMGTSGQQEGYAGATPCGEVELVSDGGTASWRDYRGAHPSMTPGFAEVPPNLTLEQVEQAFIPPAETKSK